MLKGVATVTITLLLVTGCGGNTTLAPIKGESAEQNKSQKSASKSKKVHVVRSGETLYAIAFRYGLDFRAVAKRNGISSPYVIHPGQKIALFGKSSEVKTVASTTNKTTQKKTNKKTVSQSSKKASTASSSTSKAESGGSVAKWDWPTRGTLLKSYKATGNKGIDIAGRIGQPITAAADGKVVYSGGGLIGYGELIIIKHNKNYLSAYGHNDKLLVKQGDVVKIGQHIASMGHSGTDKVKLHFEIRRDGKPVDPIRYLPN